MFHIVLNADRNYMKYVAVLLTNIIYYTDTHKKYADFLEDNKQIDFEQGSEKVRGGGATIAPLCFLNKQNLQQRRITMKRLLISSIAAMALTSSVVVAEESGAFVGLGLGFGGSSLKAEMSIGGVSTKDTANGSGLNYGLIAGYKQFFTDSFGLRYYANIDYNSSKVDFGAENGGKGSLNAINYGVNVDALYNFVSSDGMDFGAFLGLGLGANIWSGKAVDASKEMAKKANKSLSATGFDFSS